MGNGNFSVAVFLVSFYSREVIFLAVIYVSNANYTIFHVKKNRRRNSWVTGVGNERGGCGKRAARHRQTDKTAAATLSLPARVRGGTHTPGHPMAALASNPRRFPQPSLRFISKFIR